jgi:hypothetical protein
MAWSGHKDMKVAQPYIEAAFDRPELADDSDRSSRS